jgi:hypothetical protein
MFAFYSQIDDVGKGGGPALVALLIVSMGRRVAFNVAFSFWFVCGVILACIKFTIDHDVEMERRAVLEALQTDENEVPTPIESDEDLHADRG